MTKGQARSQEFTWAAQKLRGCTFSLKKVDDFFNRRPQNSPVHIFAIFEAHMTLREKTVLLY